MIEGRLDRKEIATYDEAKKQLLQYLGGLDSERINSYFERFNFPAEVTRDEEIQNLLRQQLEALSTQEVRGVYGDEVIDRVMKVLREKFVLER